MVCKDSPDSLFLKALSYFLKATPPYPQRMSLSALRCGTPKLQQRKGRKQTHLMFYMVGFFFVPNRLISRKAQCSTVLVAEELKCDVQKLRGATL